VSKRKILIDCDPGHDDAVAILYAARHLDLVGVSTVHGNNTVENTTRNALAVLELGGIDVPLAKGCAEPLSQRRVAAAAVHGKGGLMPSISSSKWRVATVANWSWQRLAPKPTWPWL